MPQGYPSARERLVERLKTDAAADDATLIQLSAETFDQGVEEMRSLAARCDELAAERDRLAGDNVALSRRIQALEERGVSLSADAARRPDEVTLAMFAENIAAKREQAIAAGVPEACMKPFDELLAEADGRPNVIALSAVGVRPGDRRPLAFRLYDALARLAGAHARRSGRSRRGAT